MSPGWRVCTRSQGNKQKNPRRKIYRRGFFTTQSRRIQIGRLPRSCRMRDHPAGRDGCSCCGAFKTVDEGGAPVYIVFFIQWVVRVHRPEPVKRVQECI
jgi:hypothetical protein